MKPIDFAALAKGEYLRFVGDVEGRVYQKTGLRSARRCSHLKHPVIHVRARVQIIHHVEEEIL